MSMYGFLFNGLFVLISGLCWLVVTAFTVWMVVDCAVHEPRVGNEKLVWIIITVFVPYLGAAIYYFVRRPARIRAYGH